MNKGFTLIELLAVIVILAVLALIAAPVVLEIIDDSKKSATLRSAENYIEGVEHALIRNIMYNQRVSNGTNSLMENGDVCLGEYSSKICTGTKLIVDVNGQTPIDGSITFEDGKIKNYNLKYPSDISVVDGQISENICTLVSGGENEIGSKYECEVKKGKKFNFFVLSKNDNGSTNLIMERNICENGKVATTDNPCFVAWQSSGNNVEGPVTAYNYLYKATKDWNKVLNINIDYIDEGTGSYGYGGIITTKKTTIITNNLDSALGSYENLKARLPHKTEISSITTSKGFLYDFLQGQTNPISGVLGYWVNASSSSNSGNAFTAVSSSKLSENDVNNNTDYGIRPVITIYLQ